MQDAVVSASVKTTASTQCPQSCAGAVQCSLHACMCCVAAASPAAIGGTPPACARTESVALHTPQSRLPGGVSVLAAVLGLEIASCTSVARVQVCWFSVLVCQQLPTGVYNLFTTGYKGDKPARLSAASPTYHSITQSVLFETTFHGDLGGTCRPRGSRRPRLFQT